MRLTAVVESQTALTTGVNATTTFNGYFAAWVAASAANFKLRRLKLGVRGPAGSVTSDQHTVALYRQTVRAAGTGLSNQVALNLDQRGSADVTSGLDFTTAATAGTNGPTLAATATEKLTMNTQTSWDVPWDYIEDFIIDQGTANGIGLVNIGNALPSSHLFVATATVEA
ncbi:MAG TPA: hypothetical protein VGS19_26885 [Streptosporangiaceae bacterium]|nr:hypothetical protein [Streptosporangiaceae bacterium]